MSLLDLECLHWLVTLENPAVLLVAATALEVAALLAVGVRRKLRRSRS